MDHRLAVLLMVGIALTYVLAPMLWHWRAWLAPSHAVTVKYWLSRSSTESNDADQHAAEL